MTTRSPVRSARRSTEVWATLAAALAAVKARIKQHRPRRAPRNRPNPPGAFRISIRVSVTAGALSALLATHGWPSREGTAAMNGRRDAESQQSLACSSGSSSISPCMAALSVSPAAEGLRHAYRLSQTSAVERSWALSCTPSMSVVACAVEPTRVTFQRAGSVSVTLTYAVGAETGRGAVVVVASDSFENTRSRIAATLTIDVVASASPPSPPSLPPQTRGGRRSRNDRSP